MLVVNLDAVVVVKALVAVAADKSEPATTDQAIIQLLAAFDDGL
jgi:hypothetical protein